MAEDKLEWPIMADEYYYYYCGYKKQLFYVKANYTYTEYTSHAFFDLINFIYGEYNTDQLFLFDLNYIYQVNDRELIKDLLKFGFGIRT